MGEAIVRGIGQKVPVLQTIEPAAIRADPQIAFRSAIEAEDDVIRQPLFRGVGGEMVLLHPVQTTAIRTYPKVSIRAFADREHIAAGESLPRRISGDLPVLETVQSPAGCANPEQPLGDPERAPGSSGSIFL